MGNCCSPTRVVNTPEEYQEEVAELAKISIREFLKTKEGKTHNPNLIDDIVKVDSKSGALKAFKLLCSSGIRVAPVWDKHKQEYIGVLDCRDIVKYAVAQEVYREEANVSVEDIKHSINSKVAAELDLEYEEVIIKENTEGVIVDIESDGTLLVVFDGYDDVFPAEEEDLRVTHLFIPMQDGSGQHLLQQVDTCTNIVYLARMRPFIVHAVDEPLFNVMQSLSRGCHIVGIKPYGTSNDDEVYKVLGQAEIFRFLVNNSPNEGFTFEEYMEETGFYGHPVQSIDGNMKTIDAFNEISSKGYSSTLVCVDDEPFGVLSSTDVRVWLEDELMRHVNIINEPCQNFINSIGRNDSKKMKKRRVITCELEESMQTVLQTVKKNRLHQLYITKPTDGRDIIGVLSMSDYFQFCVHGAAKFNNNLKSRQRRVSIQNCRSIKERFPPTHEYQPPARQPSGKRVATFIRPELQYTSTGILGGGPILHSTEVKDRMENLFQNPKNVVDNAPAGDYVSIEEFNARDDETKREEEYLQAEEELLRMEQERQMSETRAVTDVNCSLDDATSI